VNWITGALDNEKNDVLIGFIETGQAKFYDKGNKSVTDKVEEGTFQERTRAFEYVLEGKSGATLKQKQAACKAFHNVVQHACNMNDVDAMNAIQTTLDSIKATKKGDVPTREINLLENELKQTFERITKEDIRHMNTLLKDLTDRHQRLKDPRFSSGEARAKIEDAYRAIIKNGVIPSVTDKLTDILSGKTKATDAQKEEALKALENIIVNVTKFITESSPEDFQANEGMRSSLQKTLEELAKLDLGQKPKETINTLLTQVKAIKVPKEITCSDKINTMKSAIRGAHDIDVSQIKNDFKELLPMIKNLDHIDALSTYMGLESISRIHNISNNQELYFLIQGLMRFATPLAVQPDASFERLLLSNENKPRNAAFDERRDHIMLQLTSATKQSKNDPIDQDDFKEIINLIKEAREAGDLISLAKIHATVRDCYVGKKPSQDNKELFGQLKNFHNYLYAGKLE
jgi:hypothetical protein